MPLQLSLDGDLFSLIERKRLPESWALLYTAEMVSALEFLHSCGYIHRDLKPTHVLYNFDSRQTLVVDFGLVQVPSSPHPRSHLRNSGLTCRNLALRIYIYISILF